MKCPYGNERCLCQLCNNSWINDGNFCIDSCEDCEKKGEAVHSIEMCTGYVVRDKKDGEHE